MFKNTTIVYFFSTLFSTAIHHVACLCSVQDEISSRQLCVSGRNAMWEPSGSSFIYSGYARCAHQVDSTWKNNRCQCFVTSCRTHEAADVLCVFLSSLGWSQSKPLKCCNIKMSKHEWNFCLFKRTHGFYVQFTYSDLMMHLPQKFLFNFFWLCHSLTHFLSEYHKQVLQNQLQEFHLISVFTAGLLAISITKPYNS